MTPLHSCPTDEARRRLCAVFGLSMAGCVAGDPAARPTARRWHDGPLPVLQGLLDEAISTRRIPGAVLWVEGAGASRCLARGARATHPTPEPIAADTVYDVASLTKPVTATLALQLAEAGRLEIDAPIGRWLPEWSGDGSTSVRHLLTHTSGLPSGIGLQSPWQGVAHAVSLACRIPATAAPGEVFRYSDVNFILLGRIVELAAQTPLQDLAQARVFAPLAMHDSGFLPLLRTASARIAPTQFDETGRLLRGVVHDPTARRMGGVAGHAGVFSTAADLARFARSWMDLPPRPGEAPAPRLLQPATVALARAPAQRGAAGLPLRGLGWDIDSSYSRARGSHFPRGRSFGHTGFTGCSIWIDPDDAAFYVLLSNRVHPHGGESIVALYESVATAAAASMGLAR